MLGLLYRSGFFRKMKAPRTTIAGPGEAVLKVTCSPMELLPRTNDASDDNSSSNDKSESHNTDDNDDISQLSRTVYEPDQICQYDLKISKSDLKLIGQHVNKVIPKTDLQTIYQLIRLVENGQESLGLSAPQIHKSQRLFIGCHHMEFGENRQSIEGYNLEAYINPEIIDRSDKMCREAEGCLSFPGSFVIKSRPEQIRVKFTNMLGEVVVEDMDGFPARIFQHELDHLDGIVMLDYLKSEPHDTIPFTMQNMFDFVDANGNVLDKYK